MSIFAAFGTLPLTATGYTVIANLFESQVMLHG
jgi:hypothetical protein